MKTFQKVLLVLTGLFFTLNTYAQTCIATGGAWNDAGSWGCGVVPTSPAYDTIVIPPGVTITVPAFNPQTFNGTIEVYGTLTIGFLSALNMDASSSIQIFTNGTVNGFFSAVFIGGTPIGSFPPLDGPQAIDNSGGNQPLPVELVFFTANMIEDHVQLAWATVQEVNSDYFSIERSSDGINFKEIGQIYGAGNSSRRIDYYYQDEFPLNGLSYYRLRSTDFNGYTEIFDLAVVNNDKTRNEFTVYPNPVTGGELKLQTTFSPNKPARLVIYNNLGKIEGELEVKSWLNKFDVSHLGPGSYLFRLETPSGLISRRVLVR